MAVILIVDDDSVDREQARRCLRSLEEVTFVEATDGEDALAKIEAGVPDLVITDLRMPRLDGLELVRHLRGERPDLPLILMTAQGSELIAVEALRAGAASYVPKADLKSDLAPTVTHLLEIIEARVRRRHLLEFLGRAESRFEIENDPALVPLLASYLHENLDRLGFADPIVRGQVEIALVEALNNAMIHGNLQVSSQLRREDLKAWNRTIAERRSHDPWARRRVTCVARETPERVEYEISDEGEGFDASALPDPTAPENLLRMHGRGVLLIRTFMDEVRWEDGGSRLVIGRENRPAS